MLHFSLPAGRWFGVHVRVHLSLFLLLALAEGYAVVVTGNLLRGFALWFALIAAVLVREIARAIAATFAGLPLRALFLLPVGGVMALAPRQGGLPAADTRIITGIGSAANFAAALLLLGFSYGVDPHVALFRQPWITVEHILRSAVWLQVIVGAVNLLPTAALPTRRIIKARPQTSPEAPRAAGRSAFGLTTAFALASVLSGIIFGLLWPVLLGITVLLTGFLNRATGGGSPEAMAATVQDVMQTEYRPLNASSTLRDALRQTMHSVQEVFPVLRGERLVGWVSRAALATRLRAEGDGFLQGSMSRSLHAADPDEKIGDALRRAAALGAGEFVPVVQDGAMIGILTPAGLERAVGQLRFLQVPAERESL